MDKQAIYQEALSNAVGGQSLTNYRDIFEGFIAKGIPIEDIKPRVNVYTYNAWRALGRFVKKGEHGVKILTFIQTRKEDKKTGEVTVSRRPWTTTVFDAPAVNGGIPISFVVVSARHKLRSLQNGRHQYSPAKAP